jgi:hypothetical protein
MPSTRFATAFNPSIPLPLIRHTILRVGFPEGGPSRSTVVLARRVEEGGSTARAIVPPHTFFVVEVHLSSVMPILRTASRRGLTVPFLSFVEVEAVSLLLSLLVAWSPVGLDLWSASARWIILFPGRLAFANAVDFSGNWHRRHTPRSRDRDAACTILSFMWKLTNT